MSEKRERILTVLSFLAIHIVWGSTYLAIRYAVETIPPLLTAGLRHTIGGAALFAWCWSRGYRPTAKQWRASLILSVMFFLIGHGTLHWAEVIVPSGVAALLIAAEPVWVAALMAVFGYRSRLSLAGIAGLVIGIFAVAILVDRPSVIGSALFIGSIALVLGALSWALGMVYSRSAPLHPVAIMSASMTLLCGGALLVTASAVTGSLAHFSMASVTPQSALALAYLTVFGAVTFAAYSWLLTRSSPVLVATHTYTNPLIAVMLGAMIAGERVTPRIIVAAVAVIIAILLVRRDTRSSIPARLRPAPPGAAPPARASVWNRAPAAENSSRS
ncbi:MAG TPA: EamA family transporter [Thermoanaerobaculia bacterium]|nr:EamA family transporter [Thermoanaerobaculia bacterium]